MQDEELLEKGGRNSHKDKGRGGILERGVVGSVVYLKENPGC